MGFYLLIHSLIICGTYFIFLLLDFSMLNAGSQSSLDLEASIYHENKIIFLIAFKKFYRNFYKYEKLLLLFKNYYCLLAKKV